MTISLRDYPYPYKSMLAICSDLDETPNQEIYFETMRYLNTDENTLLGKGVNLEVGNTIYCEMPDEQFSYYSADLEAKKKIHQYIQSGHIDCIHSFGDYVKDREGIEKYWNELQQGDRKIEVWIDHAEADTNFDPDIMFGKGAILGSSAYHTDLTVKSGLLQFIWKGRVTSIISQNVKRSYLGIFQKKALKASFRTLLLELTKSLFAYVGSQKYKMHKNNRVLASSELIDGTIITEFMRSNPSWGGVSTFDNARGIHEVLTDKVLNQHIYNRGCSIFYTHLGKINSLAEPFPPNTVKAFELLAKYQHAQNILVTTTRRLLGYCRSYESLLFTIKDNVNKKEIHISSEYTLEDLAGLTWYYSKTDDVQLFIDNELFTNLQFNDADDTGVCSVSIPWAPLVYPK